jgi:DNA repair protein RecN (Recombination protein N)
VIGQKLRAVAAGGRQVLCVTHLPQVAAFADCHYVVARNPGESRISVLDATERVEELAAMLAGAPTEAARASARELLARAAAQR